MPHRPATMRVGCDKVNPTNIVNELQQLALQSDEHEDGTRNAYHIEEIVWATPLHTAPVLGDNGMGNSNKHANTNDLPRHPTSEHDLSGSHSPLHPAPVLGDNGMGNTNKDERSTDTHNVNNMEGRHCCSPLHPATVLGDNGLRDNTTTDSSIHMPRHHTSDDDV